MLGQLKKSRQANASAATFRSTPEGAKVNAYFCVSLRCLREKRKTLGFSRLARAQRLANSVISVLYEKKHCVRETVSSVKSVDQEKVAQVCDVCVRNKSLAFSV